ncbi:hypothetical protein CHU_1520 [Sporocytophaga myxococcoides]|uniref:Uncharacterized protein n=1 Tax=Sporocytophaga myxococcoides TaxID=153721 RepID=A0A098LIV9_9BACT|nr:hypothetical protein [Sporocytophaga myxococcoides]GAL86394.1 hypothetical protein CHU_1520 [Sporocytophaga myxococcoides]
MLHPLKLFIWVALGIVFFSCEKKNPAKVAMQEVSFNSEVRIIDSTKWHTSAALTIPEYQNWLRKQQGITYDIMKNAAFDAVIWYQPIALDAAMSVAENGDISLDSYEDYVKTKSGYHYISIEILYKDPSVNRVFNKEDFFSSLKKNLFFVKDKTDTLHNSIVEIFPSTLIGQPHHLSVLIPAGTSFTSLTAGVKGAILGFKRDLRIDLSEKQYKSLPEIKL